MTPSDVPHATTIRKLPNGLPCLVTGISLEVRAAEVNLPAPCAEFKIGDLVEIDSPDSILMGPIQGCRAAVLIVGIEHFLPRAALEQIARRWHDPSEL